jgi:hypothetical protein
MVDSVMRVDVRLSNGLTAGSICLSKWLCQRIKSKIFKQVSKKSQKIRIKSDKVDSGTQK